MLLEFRRANLRARLEDYASSKGLSSKWVGSIIRLINNQFPLLLFTKPKKISPKDYPLRDLISYLKSKGYIVYKPLPISDEDIVNYLKSLGFFVIKGVGLDGVYF